MISRHVSRVGPVEPRTGSRSAPGHPLASLHYVAFPGGCDWHALGVRVTANSTGNVVMLKKSAEADTASHTQPQVPAAARRKSSIHPLLEEQLLEAADTAGKMQLRKLIEIVSRQYDAYENDRTSLETVMRLASDEATAMTERLERESVVRLQAILDHVKDGIISVDHLGRIESMNRTAERFFGVRQSDVMSDLIDTLIPDIAPDGDLARALEELATAQETTHYDLAAREVVAKHRRGELMPAEILVSVMQSKPRPTYIVCIRDTAERSKAEEALKDSEARYRVLVENAPEAVVVLDVEIEPLRGLQRQRGRLLQDVARGPAARRPGAGEPARAGRRHALVRHRARPRREALRRRDAGVRVAAQGRRGQARSRARCASCACRAPTAT